MTYTDPWLRAPEGWPSPPDDVLTYAKEQALDALTAGGERSAVERLMDYYDLSGGYVGASFTDLVPSEWDVITAADLHATSLMNVRIGPGATRRLLGGPEAQWARAALRRLPDTTLVLADPKVLGGMYEFYSAVKHALSDPEKTNPNPWVTASKLCARKRPDLFPVRDRVVCDFLGVRRLRDVRADWLVFRVLIQDVDVDRAIDRLRYSVREAAGNRIVVLENSDLRFLDAALWTYAVRSGTPTVDEPEEV